MKPERTIMILGGTAEAVKLATSLCSLAPKPRVITSLAGRTKKPASTDGETRIGGFGGVFGMVAYFEKEKISEVVDATHPFALKITSNTKLACKLAGLPLQRISRPPWHPVPEDGWQMVEHLQAASRAIPKAAKAFLALGSQHLDEFVGRDDVEFTIRMVDAPTSLPDFSHLRLVKGLPGKTVEAEKKLLATHDISHLICRNSGGERGLLKLIAARELGIKVIMIKRPIK